MSTRIKSLKKSHPIHKKETAYPYRGNYQTNPFLIASNWLLPYKWKHNNKVEVIDPKAVTT
jgi:hypothetical protein